MGVFPKPQTNVTEFLANIVGTCHSHMTLLAAGTVLGFGYGY